MKKLLLFLFSAFFYLSTIVTPTHAADNFSTGYDVTYAVSQNGLTHVTFHITLTNKTSNYYATSYKIQVGFADVQNLKAADDDGAITPVIENVNGEKEVSLNFNKHVVGNGNSLLFTLSFDTSDVAVEQGTVAEVNIPGLSNQNDFDNFTVHVSVPKSFGAPVYIKPDVPNVKNDNQTVTFSKSDLGKSGISLAYGDKQVYSYNLSYHIQNPNVFPVKTEIALPPQTNYQNIYLSNISPKPENVHIDEDGNWLAQYLLSPSQKLTIQVKGFVAVSLFPKKTVLSSQQKALYLAQKPYWQSQDTKITSLAKQLKTPQNIYNYVAQNLHYDFSRVTQENNRLGAVNVLEHPNSAVCLEFTDLFIALSRAAGIPAREIDGFAYTKNSKERPLSLVKDVLHAWPEYYDSDKQEWIMVDPTWGNTTGNVDYFHVLDFDHFAFVIKGKDSSYPVPAGGYKFINAADTKDVDVAFGSSFPASPANVQISSNLPKVAFSAFPISGSLTVANTGNILAQSQAVTVSTTILKPLKQTVYFPDIPPFGNAIVPVSFAATPFLTNTQDTITIAINGEHQEFLLKISPFVINPYSMAGGVIIVSTFIILLIAFYRSGHLPFLRQQR
ncbi:MAG TPA: transglutaminase domain-containing protein [Candidatus Saccharimonadales bacterium]|nr:transglutaminase domain-containing protein [Candidatus Saccharimonadales bacterium]